MDLNDDQIEALDAFLLLLHQSSHLITYCEMRDESVTPVFKCDWLNRFTTMLPKDASGLKYFAETYLNTRDDLYGGLKDSSRITFNEWAVEWVEISNKKFVKQAKAAAKRMQMDLGFPSYCRAVLDRASGSVIKVPEYPRWLLDSLLQLVPE